ncbi:MAG TPA: GNAT family N-acetyltransferase, partial [Saprospiraceae bacterium]|nr:GNAT family N-acetyltransferase [Saprospiraceae bacterium]
FYAQFNTLTNIRQVILAYAGDHPVGCGAFRLYDAQSVEIKRMFVHPDYRGRGIARMILDELELWAKESGFHESMLETGFNQPEAIALYSKAGYEVIPNYGPYEKVTTSVCMRKNLINLARKII